jgi:NADPH:quinone reductase-like Zn-dependent oxidoreductase
VEVAGGQEDTMKVLVRDRYRSDGGQVQIDDIAMPDVGDDEVLVRVHAASAKLWGWDLPAIAKSIGRITDRFRKPKVDVPGLSFAGEVEAVGKNVIRFRPGAAVFGQSKGALAEYVAVRDDGLALKPSTLSFVEAATVAVPGCTALQALRAGQVGRGDHVLVVGASGGVGSFAVQLAKALGAHVAGACSTMNLDLVRSLGADRAIDYTKEDFTQDGQRYDAILDMAGNRSLADLRRTLRPGGTLVMVGQSGIPKSDQSWHKALSRWLRAAGWSRFSDHKMMALIPPRSHQELLLALADLIESGKVAAVVNATYPLAEAPEAIGRLEDGHERGRTVIDFTA